MASSWLSLRSVMLTPAIVLSLVLEPDRTMSASQAPVEFDERWLRARRDVYCDVIGADLEGLGDGKPMREIGSSERLALDWRSGHDG